MDTFYPYAWEEFLRYWNKHLANPILMSRCVRQSTTNVNESLHQKASLLVHKCKSHTTERVDFGAKHIILSQNFGYQRSSLMNVFGWISEHVDKGLALKDKIALNSAMRKHQIGENVTTHHRKKRKTGEGSGAYVGGGGGD